MFEHGYLLGTLITSISIYASFKFKEKCKGDSDEV